MSSSGGTLVFKFRVRILFVGFLTYLFTCLLRYVALPVDTFQMRKGLLTLSLVKQRQTTEIILKTYELSVLRRPEPCY